MSDEKIQQRKADHLRIIAGEQVESGRTTLLECVNLVHQALPELDLKQIDTSTGFFGKRLELPLMITSMTGGTERAGELNRGLARVAAGCGVAFATGSMRVLFRYPERLSDFAVRKEIPDGVLLGNIGGQQLVEYSVGGVIELTEKIEADGICVHLNPAHELAQDEGDTEFAGVLDAIGELTGALPGRVLVKEVGCGMSPQVVTALLDRNVSYIDVAGRGGTSWPKVESYRQDAAPADTTGGVLSEWGVPTAVGVAVANEMRREGTVVIASGGIRSGLDIARAIALGADLAGVAKPILDAFENGGETTVIEYINRLGRDLKAAMLLSGCADIAALRQARAVVTGELKDWLEQLRIDG